MAHDNSIKIKAALDNLNMDSLPEKKSQFNRKLLDFHPDQVPVGTKDKDGKPLSADGINCAFDKARVAGNSLKEMGLYDEKGKLNAAGQAYNKKHSPQSTDETAGPEEPLLAIMDDPEKNESKNTEEPEKEADEPDPKAEAEEAEEVEAEVEVGPEPDPKVEPEEEAEEAEEEEDDLKEGGRLSPKAQAEAVFGKPEEKENPRITLMRELLELFLGLWEQGENYLKPEELEIAIGNEPPEPEPEALQIEAEIEPPEPEPEALQIEAEKEQPKIEDGPPKIKDAQGDLSQAIVEYKNPESDANQDKKDESPNNAVSIRPDSTTPKPS